MGNDQNNNPFSPDTLLKCISIASIFFLLGGIIYNIAYYKAFNLNIVDYIDLSESVTLFIPPSFSILFFTMFLTPALLIMYYKFIEREKKRNEDEYKKRSWWHIVLTTLFGFSLPFGIGLLIKSIVPKKWFAFSFSTIFMLFVFYTALQLMVKYDSKISFIPRLIKYSFFYLLVFVAYLLINCQDSIDKLKNYKSQTQVVITINDSIKKNTDSVSIYIGQTKNYFFLYNKQSEVTTVIPKSKITQMDIKEEAN